MGGKRQGISTGNAPGRSDTARRRFNRILRFRSHKVYYGIYAYGQMRRNFSLALGRT